MQPATPPLEVTPEELEALLERAREALGEAGYQKLKAAIRTLSYVTELLETREAAGGRTPPRNRHRAGVAAGSLGPLGPRPAQHAAGTRTSRRRFRFADRSAGPDHARRSGHGRAAGGICRVRARDSALAGTRWSGACAAEREEAGPADTAGCEQRRSGNYTAPAYANPKSPGAFKWAALPYAAS